ncbi:MAG: hypothetical protein BJ554DRAFT_8136, partial [Olpidium bornovanus]
PLARLGTQSTASSTRIGQILRGKPVISHRRKKSRLSRCEILVPLPEFQPGETRLAICASQHARLPVVKLSLPAPNRCGRGLPQSSRDGNTSCFRYAFRVDGGAPWRRRHHKSSGKTERSFGLVRARRKFTFERTTGREDVTYPVRVAGAVAGALGKCAAMRRIEERIGASRSRIMQKPFPFDTN